MTEKANQAEEIRKAVRQHYGQIARDFDGTAASCCGPTNGCGGGEPKVTIAQSLYETPDVAELPFDVTGMSLG
jgi:hypothetical protein